MQATVPKNDAHIVNQEDEVNSNDPVNVLLLLRVCLFQVKVTIYSKLTCNCFSHTQIVMDGPRQDSI